jgi:hypothetical protein
MYQLNIPGPLQLQLDALPGAVRNGLYGGLLLAAQFLAASDGTRGWGEPVPALLPPMYILTSQGHWLLYEVDKPARAILVRTLASSLASPCRRGS